MTLRTRLTVFALGLPWAIVPSACTSVAGREPAAPRPVRVEAVADAPAPTAIRYSATIEASQQILLSFKGAGYVEHIAQRRGADGRIRPAQAGDHIAKGTLLARVKDADYRDRVRQGHARLAEAEAGLTKARADIDRARTLFRADALTKQELDGAEAAFETATARVAAAQAEVGLATSALEDVSLVAPAAGVLLERRIEVGSLVGTGTVGFTLADISSVKARFGIPDAMLPLVVLGTRIDVTVDALSGARFPGRITSIAPMADPQSRVFDVEVSLPNAGGRLRPGMIGAVAFAPEVRSASADGLLTVPLSAVIKPETEGTAFAVLVVDRQNGDDVAHIRPVELGDVVGNGITVLKGVVRGDRVVVTGAGLLVDGDHVRVIP